LSWRGVTRPAEKLCKRLPQIFFRAMRRHLDVRVTVTFVEEPSLKSARFLEQYWSATANSGQYGQLLPL
jgi:hypothetical protein